MVGIICLIDLEYIPYLTKYVDYLNEAGEQFEVLYWKRMEDETVYPFPTIAFRCPADLSLSKARKVKGFFDFRRFVYRSVANKKYDKLIVLSTLMGVLISGLLENKYSGRYIFDIRDYTYEYLPFFKSIEGGIVRNSRFTTISSDGFREFLPKSNKYVLCHNFLQSEVDETRTFCKNENGPLKLTFIGAVRHFDIDRSVVDAFSGKTDFQLVFHGYGASYQRLKDYCQGKNVILTGRYDRKDKEKLLSNCDIINTYYDDSSIVNRYAVSNKYYDSAVYRKPLWANPNTYVGKMAIEKGIGLNCGLDPKQMSRQYMELNKKTFEENCQKVVAEILEDEAEFKHIFHTFLQEE